MAARAVDHPSSTDSPARYASAWEYLLDELELLDLRLRRELLKAHPRSQADPLAGLRGLVVTDAEVAELLCAPYVRSVQPELSRGTSSEAFRLDEAIQRRMVEVDESRAASLAAGVDLVLPHVAKLFGLSGFEQDCLLICLAPEIENKYDKIYAYLQDDATARKPTVELVLQLLCATEAERLRARTAFEFSAPLMKYRLLHASERAGESSGPLLSRRLQLDERITNLLLGRNILDARLERVASLELPAAVASVESAAEDFVGRTSAFLRAQFSDSSTARHVFLHLHGPSRQELRALVREICSALALPLLSADVEAMRSGPVSFEEGAWLLGREAALHSAALCLDYADGLLADADKHHLELKALTEATSMFSRLTFLLGNRAWQAGEMPEEQVFLSCAVTLPDYSDGRRRWSEAMEGSAMMTADVAPEEFAAKFRFGRSRMRAAIKSAETQARWRSPGEPRITAADLFAACRALASPRLGTLAQKINPKYTWRDIVLPPDELAQLRELCSQAAHKHTVYGDWGFSRKLSLGKGLTALFSGPPGTGKTMAAEVMANALQLDLFRIDLSQVVSKYIGETEKNLHQIFLEAQEGHAILFFDEADALFGKRSEVKDAHDRYANIEIGYLLQKMEEYEGVAILATNLRQHIDDAFLRRLNFVVEFPFPDIEHRKRIWQVVFPEEAPVSQQVDFGLLAREIKLAGGNIKNIALSAAFFAAARGCDIGAAEVWQAARREHQKIGRAWSSTELEERARAEQENCGEGVVSPAVGAKDVAAREAQQAHIEEA